MLNFTLRAVGISVVALIAASTRAPETARPGILRPAVTQRAAAARAALPNVFLETKWVEPTGRTITARNSRALQSAIDAAAPGDVIMLTPGETYVGPFRLKRKTGNGWIVIRSAAADSLLPREGQRITPAFAPRLPKLVTTSRDASVILTEPGARGYRLMGLEITAAPEVKTLNALVRLGEASSSQGAAMPTDLIIDRTYIHGLATLSMQRCVMLNSASTAIIDSWLARCHGSGFDSQAIVGWNGNGPYKIVNNLLEGAGENLMFGGAAPADAQTGPADIEIRGNHFLKPASWVNQPWTIKNLLELKFAQRVLIEGNVFDGSWTQAQTGYAMVLKTSAEVDLPRAVTADVTIRYNVIRNVGGAFAMLSKEGASTQNFRRVTIENNLIERVNVPPYLGDGRFFVIMGGVEDVIIEHNTMVTQGGMNGFLVLEGTPAVVRLAFNENIAVRGEYGVKASGNSEGVPTLNHNVRGLEFRTNLLIGETTNPYPPGTKIVPGLGAVGFASPERGDYRLAQRTYKGIARGGKDLGADVREVMSRTAGVVVR